MSRLWSTALTLLLTASFSLGLVASAQAATVGQAVPKVTIRDANDAPATIPDFGVKVVAIFISDPDAADVNDPFADKLKAANLDTSTYRGVGIANLADTILPNSMIRAMVRKKIEKYDATILTDVDLTLVKAWGLGDLNGTGAVIVLDKKGVVRFVKKGAMTAAEIDSTHQLILKLMAE